MQDPLLCKQKRLKTAYEAAGLTEDATAANIKLRRLNEKYREFSNAAGLPEQRERLKALYPDDKSTQEAASLKVQREAEAPIREAIRRGDYPLTLNPENQARHTSTTATPGRSVVTISTEELQEIINKKAGSGKIVFDKGSFKWSRQTEIVDAEKEIGYTVNREGAIMVATALKIHYSKSGTHAVPFSGRWKK